MKKILQQFLDSIIEMLASAIEKKIEKTRIRVIEHKSIDELIRVFENTVLRQGYTTTITHHQCLGYSLSIKDSEVVVYEITAVRTQKALYEQTLSDIIDTGVLKMKDNA